MHENELDKVIYETLNQIGISHSIKGYKYITIAIKKCMKNMEMLDFVTKILYPEVAKENDTTTLRVERAIRYAVENGWEKGNANVLYKIFGYTVDMRKGKPTNSEFIFCVCDFISIYGKDILNQQYKF